MNFAENANSYEQNYGAWSTKPWKCLCFGRCFSDYKLLYLYQSIVPAGKPLNSMLGVFKGAALIAMGLV
jgi:hypothetical protein